MSKFQFSPHLDIDELDLLSEQIIKLLKNIHFGSVEIIVHDGKVVQVEKHEKFRLDFPEQKKTNRI
ncbi:MAG: YezD family protein [Methyloprofundus sp.]|nr:YezD family protein [Methyloprofundus sp.]